MRNLALGTAWLALAAGVIALVLRGPRHPGRTGPARWLRSHLRRGRPLLAGYLLAAFREPPARNPYGSTREAAWFAIMEDLFREASGREPQRKDQP